MTTSWGFFHYPRMTPSPLHPTDEPCIDNSVLQFNCNSSLSNPSGLNTARIVGNFDKLNILLTSLVMGSNLDQCNMCKIKWDCPDFSYGIRFGIKKNN